VDCSLERWWWASGCLRLARAGPDRRAGRRPWRIRLLLRRGFRLRPGGDDGQDEGQVGGCRSSTAAPGPHAGQAPGDSELRSAARSRRAVGASLFLLPLATRLFGLLDAFLGRDEIGGVATGDASRAPGHTVLAEEKTPFLVGAVMRAGEGHAHEFGSPAGGWRSRRTTPARGQGRLSLRLTPAWATLGKPGPRGVRSAK
jgi:hypothetical protein